ncbi:hypothetical protein P3T76_000748 [Phytophthora citrophthora]|uniref:Uncharacterized protein n=1 Tax=Phytophthora citrophthora TaxID=4793 RepID=A0AAD9LVT0_9STRA|nr:hypothetical protein P3T76_000748 [Phytophthora citrophthora]
MIFLPVEACKNKSTALKLNIKDSDVDSGSSMEVDDEGSDNVARSEMKATTSTTSNAAKTKIKGKRQNKHKKQPRDRSYKVTPATKRNAKDKSSNFSCYSFSSSSVVDDQGRQVSTMRRRYEDSTGRLKAVHEREIDGTKMRTTWHRQNKEDEGTHESLCSNGSPEDFEVLWQQTPFGEMQKKSVKGQLQSASDIEGEVASTAAALEGTAMDEIPITTLSTKKATEEKSDAVSSKKNSEEVSENEED